MAISGQKWVDQEIDRRASIGISVMYSVRRHSVLTGLKQGAHGEGSVTRCSASDDRSSDLLVKEAVGVGGGENQKNRERRENRGERVE